MLPDTVLKTALSDRLGVPMLLARATASPGDSDTWRLGRTALRELTDADTAALCFPHPQLSLTHAGGVAYAVRAETPLAGIGIDYEPRREHVNPRMATFFLQPHEQAAAIDTDALLRLWTVKEALFKALPANADCLLLDLTLDDPHAITGTARGPAGELLRYASVATPAGHLSVAVTPRRDRP